jgi:pimeloyl-ACP methyl ester carboxylesterase
MNIEKFTIDVGYNKLFCIRVGSGAIPILYIPGLMPMIDLYPYTKLYKPETSEILKDTTLYIINLSNFYKSGILDEPVDIDFYCKEVKLVLDKLSISKVNLMGHSAGGRCSIRFASKYPEYINKLILLSSAGLHHNKASDKMLSKANRYFAKFVVNKSEAMILRITLETLYNTTVTEECKNINLPTFIGWGQEDIVIKVEKAYKLNKLIKKSTLKIYTGIDHMTSTNTQVLTDIIKFIKQ